MKIEGAVTAMISEYPFKFQTFWKSIPISYKLLQVSLQKSAVPFHLLLLKTILKLKRYMDYSLEHSAICLLL